MEVGILADALEAERVIAGREFDAGRGSSPRSRCRGGRNRTCRSLCRREARGRCRSRPHGRRGVSDCRSLLFHVEGDFEPSFVVPWAGRSNCLPSVVPAMLAVRSTARRNAWPRARLSSPTQEVRFAEREPLGAGRQGGPRFVRLGLIPVGDRRHEVVAIDEAGAFAVGQILSALCVRFPRGAIF